MQEIHIEYDGSLDGFLTVLARCIKENIQPTSIAGQGSRRRGIFERPLFLETDSAQAERLAQWLQGIDAEALSLIIHVYLAGGPQEQTLALRALGFIKLLLQQGVAALSLHTNPDTSALLKHSKNLRHEVHTFTGLVRFRELESGVFYGPIAPIHNTILFIAEHFQKRLPLQRWMLHDTERDLALYWDGEADTERLQRVDVDTNFTRIVRAGTAIPRESVSEQEYQALWQTFHHSIANPMRENKKLQKQFIPHRYWKYLIEKAG